MTRIMPIYATFCTGWEQAKQNMAENFETNKRKVLQGNAFAEIIEKELASLEQSYR